VDNKILLLPLNNLLISVNWIKFFLVFTSKLIQCRWKLTNECGVELQWIWCMCRKRVWST